MFNFIDKLRPGKSFAAGLFLLLTLAYLLAAHLVGRGQAHEHLVGILVWQLVWGLIWFIAIVLVLVKVVTRPEEGWRSRALANRALVILALVAAWFVSSWLLGKHHTQLQIAFASTHAEQLDGTPPKAVVYWTGIPDGGTAIVRSPGIDPARLPQSNITAVTGENLQRCSRLDEELWSCRFD